MITDLHAFPAGLCISFALAKIKQALAFAVELLPVPAVVTDH